MSDKNQLKSALFAWTGAPKRALQGSGILGLIGALSLSIFPCPVFAQEAVLEEMTYQAERDGRHRPVHYRVAGLDVYMFGEPVKALFLRRALEVLSEEGRYSEPNAARVAAAARAAIEARTLSTDQWHRARQVWRGQLEQRVMEEAERRGWDERRVRKQLADYYDKARRFSLLPDGLQPRDRRWRAVSPDRRGYVVIDAEADREEAEAHRRSYLRLVCGRRGIRVQAVNINNSTLIWAFDDDTEMNRLEMAEACNSARQGNMPPLDYLP
jgi:hypothetical protein